MRPSEILTAAAERLETNGWCQGAFVSGEALCAEGAIVHAVAGCISGDALMQHRLSPDEMALCRAACWAVDIDSGDDVFWVSLHDWNDTPGRTSSEVIGQLRRTAERLRGEGR